MDQQWLPISCSLTTTEATRQLVEWDEIHRYALKTERIDGGVTLTFPIDLADDVEGLAAREATCCGFLEITTIRRADEVRLDIKSSNPAARPFIEAISGVSGR